MGMSDESQAEQITCTEECAALRTQVESQSKLLRQILDAAIGNAQKNEGPFAFLRAFDPLLGKLQTAVGERPAKTARRRR